MVRALRGQARSGTCLPFVVTYDDRFVGQLTVSGIAYGSARWGQIGYWVDQAYAGRGVIPTAVALATDHCFFVLGLHRIEINIRPENAASLRVAEKLGFRPEGLRKAYLHIDGAWRDHLSFALCAEDVPGGLLERWRRVRAASQSSDGESRGARS
jgi:[ribosomal protein S5]-alanine N-acetyltransferase